VCHHVSTGLYNIAGLDGCTVIKMFSVSVALIDKKQSIKETMKYRMNVMAAHRVTSCHVCSLTYTEEGEEANHQVCLP